MMNLRPIPARPASGLRAAWTGLFFLLLCSLPARAGVAGGNSSNGSGGNSSDIGSTVVTAPGEDVTSLPVTADSSGITLVGASFADLRNLQIVARGQGPIDVLFLPRGGVAVSFTGSYVIDVDRQALALGRVGVVFRGGQRYTDGRARLMLGDSVSAFTMPRRLILPMARLADARTVQGDFLNLGLLGPNADRGHVTAYFGAERVTLVQRIP